MKGFSHAFVRECKQYGVKIRVGSLWQCRKNEIVVPIQDNNYHTFVGWHELAHHVLHRDDKRNYDDLLSRIEIEREADAWAKEKMRQYNCDPNTINGATLGLIALYIYEGGTYQDFEIKVDDRFIILYRKGIELFSNFISNLPMHPCIY